MLTAVVLAMIIAGVLAAQRKRQTVLRQLKDGWGASKHVTTLDADAYAQIRKCYGEMPLPDPAYARVDDVTWDDLDMDAVFRRLNRTQSGVGEETLYAMLRSVDAGGETLTKRDRWMNALSGDETARLRLQRRLRALGREHDHGAFSFLSDPRASRPKHAWVYYLLALAPLVFVGLGFVNPYWLLGILVSFLLNAAVYYRTKHLRMRELAAIRHLAAVLRCAHRLRRVSIAGMEDGFAELDALCAAVKPIGRWSGLMGIQRVSDIDFITDYLRIAFQLDMITLSRLSGFMARHADTVLRLYFLVGEIDACISVASIRKALAVYAVPEFWRETRVRTEGLAHPLLRDAVRNGIDWRENILVTGSNASGKSTFIKAIAVNAVLAQTVMTCWAERFQMPRAQIVSSMAIRDNVQGGESYFIVEIKSLKRILAALRKNIPTLIFIDEILRGTNTVERIAASKALLTYISGQNALCVAATHDMELTKLLPAYRQVHFREEITPQGMAFPYKLCEGVSDTRNAIRLLSQMGFPAEVIEAADKMAAADKPAESDTKNQGLCP